MVKVKIRNKERRTGILTYWLSLPIDFSSGRLEVLHNLLLLVFILLEGFSFSCASYANCLCAVGPIIFQSRTKNVLVNLIMMALYSSWILSVFLYF